MIGDELIAHIQNLVNGLLSAWEGYFLVQIRIKPTNNVKVFLDGDQGVTIEGCTKISRELSKIFEESGLFPADDYALEVSSAGVGEPLLQVRQYQKNIGRGLEVTLHNASVLQGDLTAVNEAGIVLNVTTGKGKKLETISHQLSFEDIKAATVQVKF
ncbi:MAG: ribosome maturation factor [Bacteroidetes bacterium]|nr:MAG: ribosome maturation factor [Bacteroidota bacterium]